MFSYRFSVRDDREPVSFVMKKNSILQKKKDEKKISNRDGVNPSLIINKGIYIQHVDGGLYTKENWSNKGYSNDLCNGIALVDKVCFVIATEYIGTFRWGKNGRVDNVFAQNSSYMETVKRIIGGVKIRMRILNMIPVMKITLLIKLIAIYLKMVKMDM